MTPTSSGIMMAPPPPGSSSASSTLTQTASIASGDTGGILAATRDEMLALAQDIQSDVSSLMRSYTADRDRLRSALEAFDYQTQMMSKTGTLGAGAGGTIGSGPGSNVALIASLRQSLNHSMQQNSMLRTRLQKIHLDSDIGEFGMASTTNVDTLGRGMNMDTLNRGMNHSLSYSSSCISEFFDAREYSTGNHADTDSSDEDSAGESGEDEEDDDDETEDDDQVSLGELIIDSTVNLYKTSLNGW